MTKDKPDVSKGRVRGNLLSHLTKLRDDIQDMKEGITKWSAGKSLLSNLPNADKDDLYVILAVTKSLADEARYLDRVLRDIITLPEKTEEKEDGN